MLCQDRGHCSTGLLRVLKVIDDVVDGITNGLIGKCRPDCSGNQTKQRDEGQTAAWRLCILVSIHHLLSSSFVSLSVSVVAVAIAVICADNVVWNVLVVFVAARVVGTNAYMRHRPPSVPRSRTIVCTMRPHAQSRPLSRLLDT
ncbi:hypothetical protein OH76DRAFT_1240785 [Lentinus brumalis]|uniref:Uncharacterized protein n=1 Tax=Lentinus brumalis TaxID=2498619 RepID=A0A371CS54_9APHY|nr:hypothetical protein OH76DRAFT_1240785 [Polyporus brumalis]